jgi:agmatine deiminase
VLHHHRGFFLFIILIISIFFTIPLPASTDDTDTGLPIHLTDEELTRLHEIGMGHIATAPPTTPIRQCAEWEPVTGVLVQYDMGFGLPYELIAEYAEDIIVHVLVTEDQESNAYNALENNGVDMANVEFVIAETNSIWTRDYGPQFIFSSGAWGIIDHIYNRPRPDDDLVNWVLGTEWGCSVYGTDVIHTGGNYMTDGHGKGFSTDLVLSENPGLTPEQLEQAMQDFLGIDEYVVVPDIAADGIHHIDCWAKLLNEETILVKEVPSDHPHYDSLEANVDYLETLTNCHGRPYNIVRVLCGRLRKDEVAAYTNSVILNRKVFVPLFGISTDSDALAAYAAAMPGYEILGYEGSWLSDDAIHCRSMGVHDRFMLIVDTNPIQDLESNLHEYRVGALIDDRSEAGLVNDSLLVFWRVAGETSFSSLQLSGTIHPDSFETYIPGQTDYSNIEYYILARDNSGRRETKPMAAPGALYRFNTGESRVSDADTPSARPALAQNYPNPFNPSTTIRFHLPVRSHVSLSIYDVSGREVCRLIDGERGEGSHIVAWQGFDQEGRSVKSGVYFYSLKACGEEITRKMILIK